MIMAYIHTGKPEVVRHYAELYKRESDLRQRQYVNRICYDGTK